MREALARSNLQWRGKVVRSGVRIRIGSRCEVENSDATLSVFAVVALSDIFGSARVLGASRMQRFLLC